MQKVFNFIKETVMSDNYRKMLEKIIMRIGRAIKETEQRLANIDELVDRDFELLYLEHLNKRLRENGFDFKKCKEIESKEQEFKDHWIKHLKIVRETKTKEALIKLKNAQGRFADELVSL